MWGDLAIRWTARLTVGCYFARLYYDTDRIDNQRSQHRARCWWTIGCAIFLLHVVMAFHFEHHWNHTAALDATAKRTAEMTGWNSGIGLYVNELFLLLWLTDTVIWWRYLDWSRNRLVYWIVQFIFAFLMFQATFVFGPPLWRIVVPVLIAGLIVKRRQSIRLDSSNNADPSIS